MSQRFNEAKVVMHKVVDVTLTENDVCYLLREAIAKKVDLSPIVMAGNTTFTWNEDRSLRVRVSIPQSK